MWGSGFWALLNLIAFSAGWASDNWLEPGSTVMVAGYLPPDLSGAGEELAGPWLRADALWYLKVATQGYGSGPGDYAFYPVFPALVAVLTPLAGKELYAGLIVAALASLAGFVCLYGVIDRLAGAGAARAAVGGLALFPTSFFLVAPYAEPVLVAAASGALLLALDRRYLWASGAGLVAGLARPFGFLIALVLAALVRRDLRRAWPAVIAPIAGVLGWWAWVGYRTGDALGALRVQSLWQREGNFPLLTLADAAREWARWRSTDLGPYFLMDIAAAAFGLAAVAGGAVVLRRAGRPGLLIGGFVAYGALVLLIPLSAPFPPRPLLSLPRIVLALFPLFLCFDLVPRPARIPLASLSAAALAWTTMLFVAARPIF
ncbi:MAG: hypothetical protein ACRDI1_07390 [Actinomycetota bacterium]